MAQNGGQIKLGVGFDVDTSGLNKLKQSLSEIKKLTRAEVLEINPELGDMKKAEAKLREIREDAVLVEKALEKAFNKDLGTLNIAKFNRTLKDSGKGLNDVYRSFASAGAAGQSAFRNITTQVLTTNMQLKQSHTLINKMAETMANTVKWGVASSVMNSFTGSIQKAYGYVKNLDSSLNDIRIVTGKSAEEMDIFAVKANKAAKALGQSTRNYTDASLIYYQQGLAEQDVQARAETTLKAANVTGQSGEAVSEQLTAVWNGYKVSAQEAELYVDKLAAVAASTASDLEELSVGMGKVASAANTMGVDIDQLNGHLATVISVTRQAPESVGTAFKTIYARMSDLKLGGTDEDGLGLGDVSGTLESMGIAVLDQTGNLRDMGDVMEDVGEKWNSWTEAQKTAIAQVMAGKRQYNNLMALFENWDMYEEAVNTSANAMGTLQNQQDIYMESTEAHLQGLSTSMEDLYDSILDEGTINTVADSLAGLADLAGNFVDAIGGGQGILLNFGSIATRVFSKNIAEGITTFVGNIKRARENTEQLNAQFELLNDLQGEKIEDKNLENLVTKKKEILNLGKIVTEQQHNEANEIIKQTNNLQNQQIEWDKKIEKASSFAATLLEIDELNLKGISKDNIGDLTLLSDLKKKVGEVEKEFEATSKEIDEYNNSLKAIKRTKSLEEQENAAIELRVALDSATDEVGEFIRKNSEELGLTEELEELDIVLSEVKKSLEALDSTESLSGEEYAQKVQDIGKKLFDAYSKGNENVKNAAQDAYNVAVQESEGYGAGLEARLANIESKWTSFINNLRATQVVKSFLDVAASVGQIAGAMETLGNIKNILTDDSLSVGEKVIQTISALTMGIGQLGSGLFGLIKNIPTVIALVTGKGIAMAADAGATAAADLATKSFLSTLLSFLPIILAVVAALAVLVAIFTAVGAAWNKDANAAKRAAEAAESAAEAYDKVAASAKKVKDALDQLEESEKTLRDLKKGTEEWLDVVNQTNSSILDLLENFPQLAQYIKNIDGRLIIEDAGLEMLKAESQKQVDYAQSAKYAAQADALDKKNTSLITDFSRDEGSGIGRDNIEELVEIINTKGSGVLSNKEELEKLGINATMSEKIANNTDGVRDAILELALNIDSNNKASELYYDQIATNYLKNVDAYKNLDADVQEVIKGSVSASTMEKANQLYEDKYKDKGKLGGGIWDEDVQKQYAELIGATDVKNEGDNKATYTVDGEEIEIEDEVARWLLALNEATGGLENFVGNLLKGVKDIADLDNNKDDNDSEMQKALMTFADGNAEGSVSNLSESELTELQDIANSGKITQDMAENLGFTKIDDLVKAINDAIAAERISREEQKEAYKNEGTDLLAEGLGQYNKYTLDSTVGQEDHWMSGMLNSSLEPFANKDFAQQIIDLSGIDLSEYGDLGLSNIFENIDMSKLAEAFATMPQDEAIEYFKNAFAEGVSQAEEDRDAATLESEFDSSVEKFELDADELDAYRDLLAETHEELKDNQKALNDVSIANKRMERGVSALSDDWEDFNNIMSDSTASAEDVSKILPDINNALVDILNLDKEQFELLPPDFAQRNWALIQDVVNGVEGSIDTLRNKAGEEMLLNVKGAVDPEGNIDAGILDIHNKIASFDQAQFTVGANIEDAQFIEACNNMIQAAGMTAEQAQAYFASMGYNATFKSQKQPVTETVWDYVTKVVTTTSGDDENKVTTIEKTTQGVPKTLTGEVEVPVIETITPSGSYGGGIGVQKTAPSSARPSSSGGTGGSKGGGSTPKKKTTEPKKNPRDRYRTVNNELDKLSTKLNRLADAQNRLYGADLSKNLEKQLEIIQKQAYWSQQKLNIMEEERAELQKELEESGVTFDANLEISNYDDILKAQEDNIQELYKQRNAAAADSEEEKELDEKIADAEEARDKLLESIERYDELIYSEMPDLQDAIVEMAQQKIEIELEKFNIKIQISLDLADAVKEWGDFERDMLEDTDLTGMGKSLVNEMGKLMSSGVAEGLTSGLNNTANEIKAMNANPYTYNGIYALKDDKGNVLKNEDGTVMVDEARAMEDLKEKQGDLMNHLRDIKELEEEINELYLDSIDNIEEAYEAQAENFEFINDQLEHSLNMIELIKGEEAYEEMGKVFEQQSQNYNALLKSQKEAVDYYRQMMETETDPEAKKKWIEMWKDATNELNETVEASIELLNEQYKNTINKTIKDMDEAFGGKGARAEWEIALKKDDNYLDGVNSLYEIQALENKINEGINNTDSLSAQKRLNKLKEEELAKLREKDKLTQYDVDRANQLYEIELKKIALEEAQQNKSKMRLRRDSSGNYSYQFVADEDAQAQAQQELDEAQNKLYNMDKEEFKSRQEEFYDTWEEYQEKMKEYSELSYEERLAREDEFNEYFEYYQNRMVELSGNMNSIKQNLNQSTFDALSSLYEEDGRKFEELTDLEKSQLVDKLQPEFANTMAAMNTMLMGENGYAETWKKADDAINQANDTVKAGIEEIEKSLGLESGGLSDTTSDYYTSATELAKGFITQQDIEIQNVIKEKDEVSKLKEEVLGLRNAWIEVEKKANDALKASQTLREDQAKEEQKRIAQEEAERNKQNNSSGDSSGSGGGSGSGDSSGSSSGGGNGKVEVGDTVVYESGVYTEDSYGNGDQGNQGRGGKVKVTYINKGVARPYHISSLKGGDLGWVKKNQISGYDTGGYTGDWSSNKGKLAILHEKELVLNKKDTENMLAMISMVREIMGLGARTSTLDTSNEDKTTETFHKELSNIIDAVNTFKDIYTYQQELDSLKLLQNIEGFKKEMINNDYFKELIDIEEYSQRYQEELNREKQAEIDYILNRLGVLEESGDNISISTEKGLSMLEKNLNVNLTDLKHIVKDSFEDILKTLVPVFNTASGGSAANDLKQDIVIHANFPDATKVNEIQSAFDNLVNIASQRAHSTSALRKK